MTQFTLGSIENEIAVHIQVAVPQIDPYFLFRLINPVPAAEAASGPPNCCCCRLNNHRFTLGPFFLPAISHRLQFAQWLAQHCSLIEHALARATNKLSCTICRWTLVLVVRYFLKRAGAKFHCPDLNSRLSGDGEK